MLPYKQTFYSYVSALLLSFLAFAFSQKLKATNNEIGFPLITSFKTSNFNAHPQNWGIIQDKRGLLYFANSDGVLIYDGNSWELVKLPNNEASRSIAKDNDDIIYTAGSNELGYLQPNKLGKLEYISLIDSLGIKDIGIIRTILITSNSVYFRSSEYLIRLNKNGFKYWETKSTFSIAFIFNDNLFVQDEENGLFRVENDSLVLAPLGKEFVRKRFYFAQQHQNEVILANRIKGLYTYSPDLKGNGSLKEIDSEANKTLINDFVYCGLIAKDGNIILGTNSGGCIIVERTGKILSRITKETGILQNKIHSLFIDKDENLWLALDKGVSRCDYLSPISYWNELLNLDGTVQSLIEFEGALYIGTLQGFYKLKNSKITKIQSGISQTWTLLRFKVPTSNKEILLIGTLEGIFMLNNNRVVKIPKTSLTYKLYQSVFKPNIVYFGAEENLGILEYKNGNFEFKGIIPNTGISIRSIVEDENREIWLGTFRDGVIRIKPSENLLSPKNIEYYTTKSGLPSQKNLLIYPFNKKLLFATEYGFYNFDKQLNRFIPDKDFENLFQGKSKNIFNFISDSSGGAYATQLMNNQGSIVKINKQSDGSYTWNSLPYNKFPGMMMLVTCIDRMGNLWIGGSEGLYKYDNSIALKQPNKYYTIIRSVKIKTDSSIFNGYFFIEKDGRKYFTSTQNESFKYNIKYRYNSIKFNYSAPEFSKESAIKYQYILEGYDENWSDWTTATTKEYTNLHEGTYKFKVISNNIYNIKGEESSFEFYIQSPWYRTTIAYIEYIILAILLILTIVRVNTRKLKDTNIDLEKQVRIRTAEINMQKEELLTQSEELLAQSEELERSNLELQKLSIVASKTDNAIVIMDNLGNFEWVNEGFTNLYGLTFNDFVTKRGKNIFECASTPEIMSELHRCVDEKVTVSYEFFYEGEQNNEIWAQTTITPILDEDDNIIKLIAIDSDITKLKLAEQEILQHKCEIEAQRDYSEQQKKLIEEQNVELEKHRTQLEQLVKERTSQLEIAKRHAEESDRLKSAFLANMSHEIRTPMNAIIGFSNLINSSDITEEDRDEFTQQITNNSNALLQLIDDIIDISKIESGQMIMVKKNFNINSLLNDLLVTFKQKKKDFYNNNIQLNLVNGDDSPSFIVYSDPLRLQQVISNLLDNALKFTDEGLVEFGYSIEKKSNSPIIKFYVKDTGIGLTPEQQKQIFHRFTKFENDKNKLYRGTGLGLVICKNIINLLGGRIFVESEPNKGTTFFFTLPYSIFLDERGEQASTKNETEFLWVNKSILIAEDEPSNFRLLEAFLKRTKVKIIKAINGQEAVDLFKNGNYDLILMDIKMPVMDGLEATRVIKKLNQKIPIIALTAYAMQNDANICTEAGCDDYISKPIIKEKLYIVMNKYLG